MAVKMNLITETQTFKQSRNIRKNYTWFFSGSSKGEEEERESKIQGKKTRRSRLK